jgi:hypothetical protein
VSASGVEDFKVASKSGVGEKAGVSALQESETTSASTSKNTSFLFICTTQG